VAIAQGDDARREALGERAFVRDHDDGHAEVRLNFAEELEDLLAVDAVEVAGGLIGEKDCRAIDQGAGDGAALLFAAGEFGGAVAAACAEADVVESGSDAGGALGALDFGKTQRKLDIFLEGHAGEEIERLEDHTDGVAAVAGEFHRVDGSEVAAADVDGAGGGAIEAGQEIEEGGLAGAGAAEKSDKFAGADFERDVVDGGDDGVAESVVAGDVLGVDEWARGGLGCVRLWLGGRVERHSVAATIVIRAKLRSHFRASSESFTLDSGYLSIFAVSGRC